METMLAIYDMMTDYDAKMRRRLVYLWEMSEQHPTVLGRKLAAEEYAIVTERLGETWKAWNTVKQSLWPTN